LLDNPGADGYISAVPADPLRPLDVALLDARIHTDPGLTPLAEAVGVADGRIVAVGSNAEVEAACGRSSRRHRLGGRPVFPAFIESHTHFHRAAVLARFYIDFEDLRPGSVGDVLDAVAARAAELPADAWVQGDSLSAGRLAERRLPDRHELDRVAGGRPVVLRGIGKHVVAASSAALAAAGIDASTEDPPGGRIERDGTGEPTGILHERAKLRLDQSHPATVVPAPSAPERRLALREGVAGLHRLGIATLHEMVRLPEEAGDWSAIRADGGLGVRVRLYYRVAESPISLDWLVDLGIRKGLGDEWLAILGVKVSVDGFCIFRNALVYEPYDGEPHNKGLLRIADAELDSLVARSNAQRLQVAIHAVGVAAVDLALDAFERAGPATAGPYRLEHAYVDLDEARLARMRALGVLWSTQPAFTTAYRTEWTDAFGAARRDAIMPLAAAAAAGVPMIFNSDHPCAPIDPLGGIRAAVIGEGRADEGRVDLATAWRAFTSAPADVAGDRRLGRLVPGSAADLVVIDRDPFDDPSVLGGCAVEATMIDGRVAWDGGGVFA
jgi:predicted amidohydrolase YtcJ